MPFYEYQCNACGHRLEMLQKISDEPLRYCPECGEVGLKKLISRAAFRLKGTGWYETDFKNTGAKEANAGKAPDQGDDKGDGKGGQTESAGKKSASKPDTAGKKADKPSATAESAQTSA